MKDPGKEVGMVFTLLCRAPNRLSIRGKIFSKYCNVAKTQEGEGVYVSRLGTTVTCTSGSQIACRCCRGLIRNDYFGHVLLRAVFHYQNEWNSSPFIQKTE